MDIFKYNPDDFAMGDVFEPISMSLSPDPEDGSFNPGNKDPQVGSEDALRSSDDYEVDTEPLSDTETDKDLENR